MAESQFLEAPLVLQADGELKKIYNFWTKFRNSSQRAGQKSNRVEHFSSPHPS